MRKLLSVILAAVLMVSCCAAFAEDAAPAQFLEGADFSGILPTDAQESKVTLKDASYAMAASTDTVTVADSMIAVRTGGITMLLNLPVGYICFTQDYFASIANYSMLGDPEGLQNFMVANMIHFYLLDEIALNESHIDTREADELSAAIGNMALLSGEDLDYIGNGLADASGAGVQFRGTVKTATATWLSFGGDVNLYMTVVGGKWIIYYAGDAMEIDAEDLLNALSIYG